MNPSEFFRHFLIIFSLSTELTVSDFDLLIIHTNDIRGRYIEVHDRYRYPCTITRTPLCKGGLPRMYKHVSEVRVRARNSLFLFAGNIGFGTSWYDIYTWKISQECINEMKFDVVSLGAYDLLMKENFDSYVDSVKAPIVACNIYFPGVEPSTTLDMNGVKVGVIGFMFRNVDLYVPVRFNYTEEYACIKEESVKLRNNGVEILILLANDPQEMLKNGVFLSEIGPQIDVVVYGGTYKLYWHNKNKPHLEVIEGHYPFITKVKLESETKNVPVVTTSGASKYVGRLFLKFNDQGNAKKIGGRVDFLSGDKDERMLALLDKYRDAAIKRTRLVIGTTENFLDHKKCTRKECELGNVVTTAVTMYYQMRSKIKCNENFTFVAIIEARDMQKGISITPPPTLVVNLYQTFPYHREIFLVHTTGAILSRLFEYSVNDSDKPHVFNRFMQVHGVKVTFSLIRPQWSRLADLKIRECTKKWYHQVKEDDHIVALVTGPIINILKSESKEEIYAVPLGVTTMDIMEWYYKHHSPVTGRVEGRIRFAGDWNLATKFYFRGGLVVVTLVTIVL